MRCVRRGLCAVWDGVSCSDVAQCAGRGRGRGFGASGGHFSLEWECAQGFASKSRRIGYLGLEMRFFLLNVNENHYWYFCCDWCFVGIVSYKLSVVQWKNLGLRGEKNVPHLV